MTPSVRAAQAYNRILKLRTQCEAEIANAPQSITYRYREKISATLEALPLEVRQLTARMLGIEEI